VQTDPDMYRATDQHRACKVEPYFEFYRTRFCRCQFGRKTVVSFLKTAAKSTRLFYADIISIQLFILYECMLSIYY